MKPMIEYIDTEYGKKDLIGVEIGVYDGVNAKNILENLPIKTLYLIDPYKEYRDAAKHYGGKTLHIISKIMETRLEKYDNFIFLKNTSKKAVDDVPNDLDFVYIDGCHKYNYVMRDIELYYPKVKNGGILGGHDYIDRHPGVIKAVNEFIENTGYELNLKKHKVPTDKLPEGFMYNYDWWIIKNE